MRSAYQQNGSAVATADDDGNDVDNDDIDNDDIDDIDIDDDNDTDNDEIDIDNDGVAAETNSVIVLVA